MKRTPGKKRSLVCDISNLLFRVAAVQKQSPFGAADVDPQDLVGLCMHIALQSIYKYYEKFRPDVVVFAFEGGSNWRKEYTAKARSRLAYKGNRAYDPAMEHFYKLMESFKTTMAAHTSIICLSVPGMEADDSIAGYTQLNASDEHEVVIISGDRDFTQLTRDKNVYLINPDNGKPRNQPGDKNYEPDIEYWLFLKCIRGDMGDYVPSAFPRVRETKIKAAYLNEYDRINFMNSLWSEPARDERGLSILNDDGSAKMIQYRVGDLYEENKILVDLRAQPEPLRTDLLEQVTAQTKVVGNYSHFHFLRFLNAFRLSNVAQNSTKFADMFSHNQRYRNGEKNPTIERAIQKERQEGYEDSQESKSPANSFLQF